MKRYILSGHEPVPTDDVLAWGKMFESQNRIVDKSKKGNVEVSTVFLGLDHNWGPGPPLLFETLVFGGPHEGSMFRCSTWREAEEQHKRMCEKVGVTNR